MTTAIRVDDPDTRESFIVQGQDGSMHTRLTTLLNGEDPRGVNRTINGGTQHFAIKRIATTTAGTFLGNGNVNVAPNGTVGQQGDYIENVVVEVKAMASGGKAGVFLTQLSDPVFAQGLTGSAITNTTSQTFTAGSNLTLTANQLADRVISFQYTPTGLSPMWFTTRIVSHAAVAASATLPFTLEDTPDAGSAPTSWIIHGVLARRLLDPAAPATSVPYNITCRYEAETGGFVAWIGNGVVNADIYGVLAG
jgi:hypothetical protein